MKCSVRGVAGEVVVVTGMVVARASAVVAQRANDGQVMGLLRRQGQVFAKLDARCGGGHRLEDAAVFDWSIRLHVPGIDVRCAAAQPDHDGGLGGPAAGARLTPRGIGRRVRQVEPKKPEAAGNEERAPVKRIVVCNYGESTVRLSVVKPSF